MKISVIGLGKAGLPLAAVIANAGIDVVGVDVDKARIKEVNSGINPIKEEAELHELLKKYGGKRLKATANAVEAAEQSDVHIIIVPLFIDKNKKPDFSFIKKALKNVGRGLKKQDIVVLETTVPVGTTENLVKGTLEKISGLKAGTDFYIAYSPERIMTGHSISRFRDFPKLVGGIDNKSTEKAFEVYKKFAMPVKAANARTAELAKIAEGVYRDVNIALANELFKIAEYFNINFWEMRGAAKHEYCNILEPGNVGGHCIPVYPWFLINSMDVPLIKTARNINDDMINYYIKKIEKITNNKGKKIGLIGLSYREGVKEKFYSRSLDLINILKNKGYDVYGLDTLYSKWEIEKEFGIKYSEDFSEMDAIVLMNKESGLKDKLMPLKHKVVDVKNVLG